MAAKKKKGSLEMLASVMAQMAQQSQAQTSKWAPQWDVDPNDVADVPTVFGPPSGGGGSGGTDLP